MVEPGTDTKLRGTWICVATSQVPESLCLCQSHVVWSRVRSRPSHRHRARSARLRCRSAVGLFRVLAGPVRQPRLRRVDPFGGVEGPASTEAERHGDRQGGRHGHSGQFSDCHSHDARTGGALWQFEDGACLDQQTNMEAEISWCLARSAKCQPAAKCRCRRGGSRRQSPALRSGRTG